MKAGVVAAKITDILRSVRYGGSGNQRTTYRDANGNRCRSPRLTNPIASLGVNGHWIVISYAPFRDGGQRLPIPLARQYLAWLEAGNVGTHYDFIQASEHPSNRHTPQG